MDTIERIARAIADGLGCDFDHAFISKAEWNAARGEKGGRYRDINEPMQGDYMGAAQAILPIITRREDQARAEGVAEGLGIAAADVKTWFPGDSIDKPLSVAGKSLHDSILAKREPKPEDTLEGHTARAKAALRAVLEGLEQPSDAMKKALVDLALNIKLGGGYTWPDYAADMCKTVAAQLRKDTGL